MSEDIIFKKLEELERKIDSAKSPDGKLSALKDYRNYFRGIVDTFQGTDRYMGRMSLNLFTAMELININRIELSNKFTKLDERLDKIETMFGKLDKYK